jgi:cysteine desulfurase family protein (TIGR01976 family)
MKNPRSLSSRRKDFPSLARKQNGKPLVFFDGPAGSQVPKQVIDAIGLYYRRSNANTGGSFPTSVETDTVMQETRATVAEFLGAPDGRTISFGANTTTLNFSLSRAIGRTLRKGDEIVITQLDHEANRGPWLALRDQKIGVHEVLLKPDGTLDEDDFRRKINKRTRLVALGLASNALGTVNDIACVREWSRAVGAWLLVDAVHYVPHFLADVASMGVDFLLCSAYKFYGPHVGILYTREGLLDQLEPDRLRTQYQTAPHRIETGTLNHAAIAGVKAAIDYLAGIGDGKTLRSKLTSAFTLIHYHEFGLAREIYNGLKAIRSITIYGPSFDSALRAPTVSFTVDGLTAEQVCQKLAAKGICAWDGHFYAIRAIEALGLLDKGGVTRVGVLLYNTMDEVRRFLKEIKRIAEEALTVR